MATINDKPVWEPEIYKLTTEAAVLGFNADDLSDGPANVQGEQLANRTTFLKGKLDGLETGEIPYASIEVAQAAVNQGTLAENSVISIRSTDPNIWVTEYKVQNGLVVLSLDANGNQKDITTKAFADSFFDIANFDSSFYGGHLDNLGQLAYYINSLGQVILGENDVNINISLKDLSSFASFVSEQLPNLDGYVQSGGIVDDEGFLALYLNENGDVILGNGDINLTEYIKNGGSSSGIINNLYREIEGNTKAIYCSGDSLTAGAGAAGNGYVEQLAAALSPAGFSVVKNAVGGQGSDAIATRQGGYVNQLTLTDNNIPATTNAVTIIESTQMPITNQGGGPITGTLNGILGVVSATYDSSNVLVSYTFKRNVAGESVFVDTATPFIPVDNGHNYDIAVLWYGRNDVKKVGAQDIIVNALRASVEHLKAKNRKFLILSIINADYEGTEAKGTPLYNTIIGINETLKATWPRNYVEVRKPLVLAYDKNNPVDVQNFLDDIPPSSLRADGVHLNSNGYAIIKNCVYAALKQRGWL